MGSGVSTEKMIIHDLANRTSFGQTEIKQLKDKFAELAAVEGNPNSITIHQLGEAIAAVGIDEQDTVLMKKVFNMMDTTHDGQVFFKDFVVCCSHLVSSDPTENLCTSFHLYADEAGFVTEKEMREVISHSNKSASWFGDHVLSEAEIDALVTDVFKAHGDHTKNPSTLSFVEYSKSVIEHPILVKFMTGKGDLRAAEGAPAIALDESAAQADTAPADATPTDAAPTEAAPTEATPAEAAPTEATPAEAAPTEATPADAAPTEAAPTEATPADAAPAEAATTEAEPASAEAAPTKEAPADAAAPAEAAPAEAAT